MTTCSKARPGKNLGAQQGVKQCGRSHLAAIPFQVRDLEGKEGLRSGKGGKVLKLTFLLGVLSSFNDPDDPAWPTSKVMTNKIVMRLQQHNQGP
eukprot:bmy_16919T0